MPLLSRRLIEATQPADKEVVLRDDGKGGLPGFHVRVMPGGSKTYWLYYRTTTKKERRIKLGRFEEMVPEKAREIARELIYQVRQGQDPVAERQASATVRREDSFAEAVEDYIQREQIGRKGNATADEVRRTLLREGSTWNRRPVGSITAAEVRKLVEGIRDGDSGKRPRPYMANRTHAYLRTFFAWCAEPGIDKVERSPVLGLKRPWEGEESRDRVFTDHEIVTLWRLAERFCDERERRTGPSYGAFLKCALLTGKRKGSLASMQWGEIDQNGLWTPEAGNRRRKSNKRRHAVPLSSLALQSIQNLPRIEGNPFVFAGRVRGKAIDPGSQMAQEIKSESGIEDFFFHACRHTVETRLAELRVAPHIRDLLLDHAPARGSGAGYDHHHYEQEMREAVELWARHIQLVLDQAALLTP